MSTTELEDQVATPTDDLADDDFTLDVVEDTSEDDLIPEISGTNDKTSSKDKINTSQQNNRIFIALQSETNSEVVWNHKTNNTPQQNDSNTPDLTCASLELETSLPDTDKVAVEPNNDGRPKRRRNTGSFLAHSCSYCSFKASNISDFYIHQLYCRPVPFIACNYSGLKIRGEILLNEHLAREHVRKKRSCVTVSRSAQTDESIFHLCSVCRFKTVDVEEMDKHRASHDKWTMYLCDLCDFKDLSLVIVRRHRAEHGKAVSAVGSTE